MDKQPLPTVQFDPSIHVIECRERREGRTVLVTLESLSQAERQYEHTGNVQPADLSALHADFGQLVAGVEHRLMNELKSSVPPPQLSAEVQGLLGEMAGLMTAMQGRIAQLEMEQSAVKSRVDLIENTLRGLA